MVKARYDSVPGARRTWIDVDFGPELGFLWSADAADFEVAVQAAPVKPSGNAL
jgi:hypothetical protein